MTTVSNCPYNDISVGQTATYSKQISAADIDLFAVASGDHNPVHLDEDYASSTPFGGRIAHGMLTGGVISAALAMKLPGPGTIYLGQSLRFRLPVAIGDTVTVELEVVEKRDRRRVVILDCRVYNQDQKLVATGQAEVMAPDSAQTVTTGAPKLS